jgi:hypothetical protein
MRKSVVWKLNWKNADQIRSLLELGIPKQISYIVYIKILQDIWNRKGKKNKITSLSSPTVFLTNKNQNTHNREQRND